jgi:serine protease Do
LQLQNHNTMNMNNFLKLCFVLTAISNTAIAQTDSKTSDSIITKKKIFIQRNGSAGARMEMKVEVNGDKVIVNGKPIEDFQDGNFNIDGNKKMIIITDDLNDKNSSKRMGRNKQVEETIDSIAFLGVVTEADLNGARISEVVKESAAEKAGLQMGDIITSIDNEKIDGPQSLTEKIQLHNPFDVIKIGYLRNGKKKSTSCTLQFKKRIERKIIVKKNDVITDDNVEIFQMPEITDGNIDISGMVEGLNLEDLNLKLFPNKQKLGVKIQDTEDENGVKVIDVSKDGLGEKSGLLKDDIIFEIAGEKIKNTDDARYQLREVAEKKAYNVKVLRNGKEMIIEIKNPKELKTVDL